MGRRKDPQKFLEQDLIEAIIGLPPNLFYGAGIPACILVMRPNLTGQSLNPNKPAGRRGQVLFINADAEFHAGRAQNYLRPEHVEKIVSTFDRFEDVPGYARRVSMEEIGSPANDWNLNIRRYVDNPPPEPHDVRAHLQGGVPAAEVQAKRPLFNALGFDPTHAFTARTNDVAYFDFAPALADRPAIRALVENDVGVQARTQALHSALAAWWDAHAARLADLPAQRDLNAVRLSFSIPLLLRSRRRACSTASSSRASSPPGGPTRCPTSRRCSKTVSQVSLMVGWTPLPTRWKTTRPPARPSTLSPINWSVTPWLTTSTKSLQPRLTSPGLRAKKSYEQATLLMTRMRKNWRTGTTPGTSNGNARAESRYKDASRNLARLERAAARARATDADAGCCGEPRQRSTRVRPPCPFETELALRVHQGQLAKPSRTAQLTDAFVDELKSLQP